MSETDVPFLPPRRKTDLWGFNYWRNAVVFLDGIKEGRMMVMRKRGGVR